jgi:hypothetical protein
MKRAAGGEEFVCSVRKRHKEDLEKLFSISTFGSSRRFGEKNKNKKRERETGQL